MRRRVEWRQLVDIVAQRAVALRGWNYPHIPREEPPQGIVTLADGGVEATTDVRQYHEVWRLHPNGLFTHRWRLREDGTGYKGTIHFVAAIYSVAEVFEFGRRLFRDDETVSAVTFRVALEDVLQRTGSGDSLDDLPYGVPAMRNEATHSIAVPRAELAAGVLGATVDGAESLFGQLGFMDIGRGFIEAKAQRFLSGRL
jgi:hypothetical protein